MGLDDYLKAGWVTASPPQAKEIDDLFGVADRELADAKLAGLSTDGKFAHAYAAALACAAAALAAAGYHPSKGGSHHYYVIQSLEHTLGLDDQVIHRLQGYRKKRNTSVYDRAGAASTPEAADALAIAEDLRSRAEQWIKANYPDLRKGAKP